MEKVHNSPRSAAAKVAMRLNVLEHVAPARVFDAFCGPDGAMFDAVWRHADQYVGCDLEWRPTDTRRRFAADNRDVLRVLDLSVFNVFDVDAFGCPWEQMTILAERRKWGHGERGAVVVTDGSSLKTRFGGMSKAAAKLIGVSGDVAPTEASAEATWSMATTTWFRRCGLRVLRAWTAEGRGSGKGGALMRYAAYVFEGCGPNP